MNSTFIYVALMALTTFAVRVIPLTLIQKQIENRFIRSFLFYVPYVTLSVMTFPAIVEATQTPISGLVALLVGVAAAWFGLNLFNVAVSCCLIVFVLEFFIC